MNFRIMVLVLAIVTTTAQAAPKTKITGISLSNYTFPYNAASGTVIGNILVSQIKGTFAGTVTVDQTAYFQIVGMQLQTKADVPPGSYAIVLSATEPTALNSPFSARFNVTGAAQPTLYVQVTPSAPYIAPNVPLGSVVANLQGIWSDGAPFLGGYLFAPPNYDAGSAYLISGDQLIVNPSGPGVPASGTQHVNIEATQ